MNAGKLAETGRTILNDAVEREFYGADPYDGLNTNRSSWLLGKSRFWRLVQQQVVKRSPLNLRPLLGVRQGVNPKALSLFLSGVRDMLPQQTELINELRQMLLLTASRPDGSPVFNGLSRDEIALSDCRTNADLIENAEFSSEAGWGYNFPWQSRAFMVSSWIPTAVATSFAVDALNGLDNSVCERAVAAAARFIESSLHRHSDFRGVCFSYSPFDRTVVYNASLLAARVLAQAASQGGEKSSERFDLARSAVEFVVTCQRSDGAWVYGEADHWGWIDNLHTGFILQVLEEVSGLFDTSEWDESISRGLEFYRKFLFTSEGLPMQRSDSFYPEDPHTYAQAAITFIALKRFSPELHSLAEQVLESAVQRLWNRRTSSFHLRKKSGRLNKTIYLRWSQAWMFRAISKYVRSVADL
ncbi:hypothetical protein CSA37_07585 [Candidatus Fermentibacteria bacterium]|nr:MAG: hypothetical protein CSA37_07585 [Candidatus Fermentibacteria bacterium]